ncbi:MAG TPA: helix-turn-helix domain-containing protein [Pseudonocardia sp.]|nr:helix-turn-helix domain-containing protein [Pseudonocardia sp.]
MAKTPSLRRGQRLAENQRNKIGAELLRRYEQGRSVREICTETGYSIGRVRRLLQDAGVTFRPRGGARARVSSVPEKKASGSRSSGGKSSGGRLSGAQSSGAQSSGAQSSGAQSSGAVRRPAGSELKSG